MCTNWALMQVALCSSVLTLFPDAPGSAPLFQVASSTDGVSPFPLLVDANTGQVTTKVFHGRVPGVTLHRRAGV